MEKLQFLWFTLFLLLNVSDGERTVKNYETDQRSKYTASWAVEITEGGEKMAERIAQRYGFSNLGKVANLDNIYHFKLNSEERARAPTDFPYDSKSHALRSEPYVGFAEQQVVLPHFKRSYSVPQDPLFQNQWNLLNSGQYGSEYRGNDLNVEKAWLLGLTGCNVTIGVVDDGIDYTHEDLWDNFDPFISYDVLDDDPDPMPRHYHTHGTSCAGIVSAAKNNDTCGVGIAYNSNLAGIRGVGFSTDMDEAVSLSYANDVIDIYSNSWGPCDDGCVGGPERLTQMALKKGAETGREGKGSIFVWANGNGGDGDNCGADSYATSIYTISVGAVSVTGEQAWFDEKCSAKMVVNYVTDTDGNSSVSTTANSGQCTISFGGTSAATPMASGIIALTLQTNPWLTWRDVQYLLVYTSNPSLTSGGNYYVNGAGNNVSHEFGFGVMDAEAMVSRARHWISVPSQMTNVLSVPTSTGYATSYRPLTTTFQYSGFMVYLEHVVVKMTLASNRYGSVRGDIKIQLTSPSGTQSTLLDYRYNDHSRDMYDNWPFMSVMFWGENPRGQWALTIQTYDSGTEVEMRGAAVQFYGTSEIPEAVRNIPDQCHSDCARGCAADGSSIYCDACVNYRNADTFECIESCPSEYTERNGYCYNPDDSLPVCDSKPSKSRGSCVAAGYLGCCKDENCSGFLENITSSCFCDEECYNFNDCCDDITEISCTQDNAASVSVSPMPYITLGTTTGVATLSVPSYDDGVSARIRVPVGFPFGNSTHTRVYVCTNGFFVFDRGLSLYAPYLFPGSGLHSIIAPFFTDTDISGGVGRIRYEIHTNATSQHLLSNVNNLINEHMGTEFSGEWLLIAEWNDVPAFAQPLDNTNTFQGIVTTDHRRSFAVFTYKCGDIEYSNLATIGFTAGDELFANHPLTRRRKAQNIACINSPDSQWVNVVYELTHREVQPTAETVNECEDNNGGCEHTCTDTATSFECSCRDGYSLNSDAFSCDDIDECEEEVHNCDQLCINTIGSFSCGCRDGFSLDADMRSCVSSCNTTLSSLSGSFQTPGWPDYYPSQDFQCQWIIDLNNDNYIIRFTTDDSAYGIRGKEPCPTDYLAFYDGPTSAAPSLGKYCFLDPPPYRVSSTHQAMVVFQASSLAHRPSRVGARVSYEAISLANGCEENNGGCEHICVDTINSYECRCEAGFMLDSDDHSCVPSCGGRLTQTAGSLSSPGWPHYYPSINFRCVWVIDIENQPNALINITFNQPFGIRGRDPCRTDYVQVLDGVGEGASSLGKFCFLNAPQPITTSSNQATVIFQASRRTHRPSRVGVGITYSTY